MPSQKLANLENMDLGIKGKKNTWSDSIWIILPRDFYHLLAICIRLQGSSINGVFVFQAQLEGIIAPKKW